MSDLPGRQLQPAQQLLMGVSPSLGQAQFVPAFSGAAMPGQQQPLGTTGPLLFSQRQPLPKQLTAAIKSCTSLERLSQLFAAHQAVLNPIHIAAMITKLPKLDTSAHNPAAAAGSGESSWNLSTGQVQQLQLRQLLQQLLLRLKAQGCSEYSPRGVANIVWALAKLQCAPDPELRCMLLDKFCSHLPTAVPQDISNVLWGVAKITKERAAASGGGTAAVLQPLGLAAVGSLSSPGSSTSNPSLAGSVISGQSWVMGAGPGSLPSLHGSGSHDVALVAAASAPLLAQDQVRLLLQHLCQQLHTASVQTISNSLWAVVVLQQEHQWCMCNCLGEFQQLLSAFCRQPHQALPGHIQPVVRCMAQLATTCSNHAGDSWLRWQPPLLQQLLGYLRRQCEQMEMHHVSSVLRDIAQVVCLHLLRKKQLRDQQQQACGMQPSSSSAPASSSQPQQMNTISGEAEGEEVLARLAASGGPQDTSSTIVALAMLQPQLEQLGLQQGVAALCSMLPPAALPQLGEEASRRLLAATSAAAASQTAAAPAAAGSGAPAAAAAAASAAATAAQHLQLVIPEQRQQAGAGMPSAQLITPSALAGSSSASNSSSSNAVIGSGGEGSSSCSTSLSATGPIVSPQPQQQVESQSAAASAAAAPPPPAAAPGFTALEGLLLPDADEAAAAAAAAARIALPVAGDSAGSLSSRRSLDQQQQQNSGPLPAPPQQAPAAASSAAGSTAAAAAPAVVVISSPRQPQPPPPPPLSHSQLHGLASNPASAGSGAEPLPLAVSAAAGDDGASLSADKEEAAARQLTHNIANADSVNQLAEIFTAHSSVMDMIHITACITRLSKVLGTAPSAASQAAASSLLPLLGNKLLQVLPNANARGIANVLWGYGRLRNLPQSDLLPELLKAFLQQLPTAACRDSAVVLWSLARLTEGQGMAAVGVTPDLLSRLGRQVLEQLSASAAAALDGQSTHQPPPPQHGKHDRNEGDPSAPPSSRDVSNSLMALTRLGFVPESAAAAAAADKGTAAAAAAEGAEPAPASPSAASAATAAAEDKDSAAPAAALESLSLDAAAPAAAASKADQEKPADKQEPAVAAAAATAAGSSDSQAKEQQQQQLKPLTLAVAPIKVLVQFLLRHAAVAKTLDLQETATALKQLGLQDLSAQVAAAICSPAPGGPGQHGMFDAPGHHHGMGMGPGSMQYGHSGGMQHFHQHMGPGSGMQHGFGGGMRPGGGHMYGGPGLSGRPGSGSYGAAAAAAGVGGGSGAYGSSASNAVLARNQPGPAHTPSVSMPSTINLSGTQLAGLLQQQRRQQPLPMSGPAYGAGWLPGKTSQAQHQQQQVHRQGSSGAACFVPGVDGSGMMGQQQQQQQQYRMYMPGGSSGAAGGSPGMRRLSGGAHAGMSYAADASQAGSYMSGPGPAGGAGMHDYMQPNSMQYQQQYQRRQQQQQPHGQQEQWGAQMASGQGMRRLSGAQHTEVPQQQLQQHQQQGYDMPAGEQQQPGVQYMFVPQQYNTQQQQQQAGTYPVPQQGIQQQQQPGMGVMMQQVLQQPQQQQTVAGQQQMVMMPVSMASGMFNIAQPVSSLPGQQQQQGLAATPGVMQMQMQPQQVAGTDTWIGQGYAGAAQQQQQSQQLMQMLPQIQAAATAAGTVPAGQAFGVQGGSAGVAAFGMPYQVSGGMLVGSAEYVMPVESEVVVGGQMLQMVGSGQLSADYAAIGLAAPAQQQQQQVYGGMPGAGGSMLQQQGARVGLDPPGLYVPQQQQQQQQQDAMQLMYGMVQQGMPAQQQQQQQQQGVVMMGPGAGYAFAGGQYQQQ